jgi:hypothetical protein
VSSIRVVLRDTQMGAKFRAAQGRQYRRIQAALGATAREAAAQIKERGDADISSAGNFGRRWTEGFRVTTLLRGSDYTIQSKSDTVGFNVFEYGATIRGKPLLWIPLSFAQDAQGVMARDFKGGLFRVDRKSGAPLLLSIADRRPKYFGKESVRIPKKFHIRAIAREVAKSMKAIFKRKMSGG